MFRTVKAQELAENLKYEQLGLPLSEINDFFKEREFRIPLSEIYRIDSSRKDLRGKEFSKNVYLGYTKNMVTDKTRSSIEQKFEEFCDNSGYVNWFYKNGDKGDRYFSVAYRDGVGQVRLFYPDYIIKSENDSIWIIETKGGERSNQSQNIDPLSPIKFDAFKKYVELRHPEIKWGFVRNIGEQLFLNNSSWSEQIAGNENWVAIEEYFNE